MLSPTPKSPIDISLIKIVLSSPIMEEGVPAAVEIGVALFRRENSDCRGCRAEPAAYSFIVLIIKRVGHLTIPVDVEHDLQGSPDGGWVRAWSGREHRGSSPLPLWRSD